MSDTDHIHERLVDDLREMLESFGPDDTDEDLFFAYMIAGAIGRAVTAEEPDLDANAFRHRFFRVLTEFLEVYHHSVARSEPSDPDEFKLTDSDSLVRFDDGTAAVIVGGDRADLPPEVADMIGRLKLDLSECTTADGAKEVLISHGARQDKGGSDEQD